jgi:hypothetical protein
MTRAGQRIALGRNERVSKITCQRLFFSLLVRLLLSPMPTDPEDFRVSTFLFDVVVAVQDQHEIAQLRRGELDV